jgi:hypothetical protein
MSCMGSSTFLCRLIIKQLVSTFLYNALFEVEVCLMGKCQSVFGLEMVSSQPKVMHKAESLSKNNI